LDNRNPMKTQADSSRLFHQTPAGVCSKNHFREDLSGEYLSEEWEEGFADYSPDNHSPDISGFFDPSSSALVAAGRAVPFALFRGSWVKIRN